MAATSSGLVMRVRPVDVEALGDVEQVGFGGVRVDATGRRRGADACLDASFGVLGVAWAGLVFGFPVVANLFK